MTDEHTREEVARIITWTGGFEWNLLTTDQGREIADAILDQFTVTPKGGDTAPLPDDEQAVIRDANEQDFQEWSHRDMVDLIRDLGKALEARRAEAPKKLDPRPWIYGLFGPQNDTYFESDRGREVTQVTGGFVFAPRERYSQNKEDYA